MLQNLYRIGNVYIEYTYKHSVSTAVMISYCFLDSNKHLRVSGKQATNSADYINASFCSVSGLI